MAVDRLTRAGKELEEALSAASFSPRGVGPLRGCGVPPATARRTPARPARARFPEPAPDEAARAEVVELLVGMLLADQTVSLAAAAPSARSLRYLTAAEIAEIVRRIEEVSLGGIEVDRLVERMAATLDTLQNLGHPIQRYRRLARLEKSQKEIHLLRERIRERRDATVATIEAGRDGDAPGLLKDVGLFLKELDEIRSIAAETRDFTKQYFDILRKKEEPRGEGGGSPRPCDAGIDRVC